MKPPFVFTLAALSPGLFPGSLGEGISARANEKGLWTLQVHDIRAFGRGKHRSVDDTPFGGGPGMVMRPEVADEAFEVLNGAPGPLVFLSPRGEPLSQPLVRDWAKGEGLRLFCGQFEGVDQRVLDKHQPLEVSVGDYVLSCGELAALVVMDVVVRVLSGVLGNAVSPVEESFSNGLLEYPHYTRPRLWQGREVPSVLLSGHHENIQAWRLIQAEQITQARRPDLWERNERNRKGKKT